MRVSLITRQYYWTELLGTGLFCWLLMLPGSAAGAELQPTQAPLDIHAIPQEAKVIIWGFMRELELPNPFEQPEPQPVPPDPRPTPDPKPEPVPPVVAEKDDFLWEEDNFLDDPRGFDEIKADFDQQYRKIKEKWDKQLDDRMAIWQKPRADFLNFYDTIVAQTAEASSYLRTQPESLPSYGDTQAGRFDAMKAGDFHIIPQSMHIPIRDQAYRGTCVAFAFVRGMESILASRGKPIDLSENHFYWLAKNECRTPGQCVCTEDQRDNPSSGCVTDGLSLSNAVKAFQQPGSGFHVVPEAECSYKTHPYPLELTGTPLQECQPFKSPVAKPAETAVARSSAEWLDSILNNRPLIFGAGVTKRMMQKNDTSSRQSVGQAVNMLQGDSQIGGGHAMLGIGIIKLPQKYWPSEGRYCLITANSWGQGYGLGGYTCFTEKWLGKYLSQAVSLKSINVLDPFYPH